MGQPVEVVVSEMSSAAARLGDVAQRLQDGLATVSDETTQLLGSDWKGKAASAYGPAWEQWHGGAAQIVAGLQRMSELLTIAGKEYAKTDESAADGLGSTMQGARGATGSDGGTATSGRAVGLGNLGLGDGGGASTAGGADQTAQSADGGQQAMSSASQVGLAAVQQAGQAAVGLTQLATGLAQLVEEAQSGDDDAEAGPVEEADEDAESEDAAAASGARTAASTPAEYIPVSRADAVRPVARPSE